MVAHTQGQGQRGPSRQEIVDLGREGTPVSPARGEHAARSPPGAEQGVALVPPRVSPGQHGHRDGSLGQRRGDPLPAALRRALGCASLAGGRTQPSSPHDPSPVPAPSADGAGGVFSSLLPCPPFICRRRAPVPVRPTALPAGEPAAAAVPPPAPGGQGQAGAAAGAAAQLHTRPRGQHRGGPRGCPPPSTAPHQEDGEGAGEDMPGPRRARCRDLGLSGRGGAAHLPPPPSLLPPAMAAPGGGAGPAGRLHRQDLPLPTPEASSQAGDAAAAAQRQEQRPDPAPVTAAEGGAQSPTPAAPPPALPSPSPRGCINHSASVPEDGGAPPALSIPPRSWGTEAAASPPHHGTLSHGAPPLCATGGVGGGRLCLSPPPTRLAEGHGLTHQQGCGQDTGSQLMGMTPPLPPPRPPPQAELF